MTGPGGLRTGSFRGGGAMLLWAAGLQWSGDGERGELGGLAGAARRKETRSLTARMGEGGGGWGRKVWDAITASTLLLELGAVDEEEEEDL